MVRNLSDFGEEEVIRLRVHFNTIAHSFGNTTGRLQSQHKEVSVITDSMYLAYLHNLSQGYNYCIGEGASLDSICIHWHH